MTILHSPGDDSVEQAMSELRRLLALHPEHAYEPSNAVIDQLSQALDIVRQIDDETCVREIREECELQDLPFKWVWQILSLRYWPLPWAEAVLRLRLQELQKQLVAG